VNLKTVNGLMSFLFTSADYKRRYRSQNGVLLRGLEHEWRGSLRFLVSYRIIIVVMDMGSARRAAMRKAFMVWEGSYIVEMFGTASLFA